MQYINKRTDKRVISQLIISFKNFILGYLSQLQISKMTYLLERLVKRDLMNISSRDLFYHYLAKILLDRTKKLASLRKKTKQKLLEWIHRIKKMLDRGENINSLVMSNILMFLSNPNHKGNITEYYFCCDIVTGYRNCYAIDEETCEEITGLIQNKLKEDKMFIRCFGYVDDSEKIVRASSFNYDNPSSDRAIKHHIAELLTYYFSNGNAYICQNLNGYGETTFDRSIYINEVYYLNYLEMTEINDKLRSQFFYTICHELAHSKRQLFSVRNYFTRRTPEKNFKGEMGWWVEEFLGYGIRCSKITNEMENKNRHNQIIQKRKCGTTIKSKSLANLLNK
jgi:hypothetical protein